MAALKTPLEVYKLLNKSNCRKCMLPSCLAFAAAVIQGQKKLSDCPELDTRNISGEPAQRKSIEDGFQ
ncbi:MAG: Fe-S cluster protein, partial [Candidatus Electrothrix sp. AR5]|nr:Fe-S cluster protein [Candidatus Electrothrix sp. AR5]